MAIVIIVKSVLDCCVVKGNAITSYVMFTSLTLKVSKVMFNMLRKFTKENHWIILPRGSRNAQMITPDKRHCGLSPLGGLKMGTGRFPDLSCGGCKTSVVLCSLPTQFITL